MRRERQSPTPAAPAETPAARPAVVDPHLVRFDPVSRRNFHLDDQGEPAWHGVPDGFEFTEEGTLVPVQRGGEE